MKLFGLMNAVFLAATLQAVPALANNDIPKDDVHKGIKAAGKVASLPKPGEIAKAKGGKTVAELFDGMEKLNSKKIVMRAKVMKVNRQIMGKDWVTLADGTGKSPDDKVVATTTLESPTVGDVVTVSGVLKTNVDLGSGYLYKVIIEDARFVK